MKRWSERPITMNKRHTCLALTWGDALALAGSALSQDEAPRKAKRGKR